MIMTEMGIYGIRMGIFICKIAMTMLVGYGAYGICNNGGCL